jgi:hypothetical protein
MHYDVVHTHRWSWVFDQSYQRLLKANAAENDEEKHCLMEQIVHGDLCDDRPDEILPGVLMWLPYYRGVQGEMDTRYTCIRDAYDGEIDEALVDEQSLACHKMFLEDVKTIVEEKGFLSFGQVTAMSADGIVDRYRMPDDWAETYQTMRAEILDALETNSITVTQLQEWMLYCLRGLITYNYWLARQASLAYWIADQDGNEALKELIEKSKNDFGWLVSRVFFHDTMQRAGVEGAELYKMGRYAMFCDQIMLAGDREKADGVLKARESILKNCELYQGIKTPADYLNKSPDLIGVIVCEYCENHGKKNAAIFTPPDQHPDYRRIESFGYGDNRCVFHNDFTEGDDDEMDRFMEAQEIVFGDEEYEAWD